ncbi:hypothetical protein ABIE45_006345 [Methylobacterium sp. OAE515]|uniref:hypothetical protein n=1 Tax=Methylobacterium sp. OAE515 TaxID=2817895 RepID=UPI00178BB8D3
MSDPFRDDQIRREQQDGERRRADDQRCADERRQEQERESIRREHYRNLDEIHKSLHGGSWQHGQGATPSSGGAVAYGHGAGRARAPGFFDLSFSERLVRVFAFLGSVYIFFWVSARPDLQHDEGFLIGAGIVCVAIYFAWRSIFEWMNEHPTVFFFLAVAAFFVFAKH